MVGAPEILWIVGGDELESGNCDCGMTKVAKVLFGDGTTDDQRVTKTIVRQLRAEDCEVYSHGPPGVEFDYPTITLLRCSSAMALNASYLPPRNPSNP